MPPPGAPVGITANRFSVKIGQTGTEISFTELSGITTEVEPVDLYYSNPSGDGRTSLAKLPGKYKAPTIVLKRGSDSTRALWDWHGFLRDGKMKDAQQSGTLTMYGPDLSAPPVAIYHFEDAWCTKLQLTGAKAGNSEVLVEECTIVCSNLFRAK